ncbi:MAG TPA: hypothetical protein G4N92_06520 [Anaerolineae bacterium]|nr:hypothetical protein [Anaerolineae bacterium]
MNNKSRDASSKNKQISEIRRQVSNYGKFYLSQGFKSAKRISNDCGPTTVAMAVNMLVDQIHSQTLTLNKDTIINQSGLTLWDRIPAFVPIIGGAMAPWGIVRAFNNWTDKLGLPWRAQRKSHASSLDILENTLVGNMVTILKVWKNGGAHWVNVVEISTDKDRVYLLDPNPYLVHLTAKRRIQSETWEKFTQDWSRQAWWTYLFRLKNEMILYSQKTMA